MILAMFLAFALHNVDGSQRATGAPTFAAYKDRAGANRTAPSISHIGLGEFVFSPSAADVLEGVAFLIGDASSAERYLAGTLGAGDFSAFAVYDAAGAPKTDATPTFTAYKTGGGIDVTPPSVVNLGLGLYGFVPAANEFENGAAFDLATGAYPASVSGTVDVFTAPPPEGELLDVATDVAAYLASAGIGLTAGTNLWAVHDVPDYEGGQTAPMVFVLGSGGPAPAPYLGTGRSDVLASASILVRGVHGQEQESADLARDIAGVLQLADISGYYSVLLRGPPTFIKIDEHDAPGWSVGVECRYTL